MSRYTQIRCDGCGLRRDSYQAAAHLLRKILRGEGWRFVALETQDYCPECWGMMSKEDRSATRWGRVWRREQKVGCDACHWPELAGKEREQAEHLRWRLERRYRLHDALAEALGVSGLEGEEQVEAALRKLGKEVKDD